MRCNDCGWVIVAAALLAGAIACCAVGSGRKKLWALSKPWDNTGNYCGINNGRDVEPHVISGKENFKFQNWEERPYLFFGAGRVSLMEAPTAVQICVSACPKDGFEEEDLLKAILDTCDNGKRICPPDVDELEEKKEKGRCICPYRSTDVLGRCVPDYDEAKFDVAGEQLLGNFSLILEGVKGLVNLVPVPGFGENVMRVVDYRYVILVAGLASVVVCLFWIVLLRWVAPCVVYAVAIGVPLVIVGLGVWMYCEGQNAFGFKEESSARYFACALFGVAAIILLIVIFLWSRLKEAVAVVKLSSKALFANWGSVFTPVLGVIELLGWWAFSLVAAVFLYSAQKFKIIDVEDKPGTKMIVWSDKDDIAYYLIYVLIFVIFVTVHVYFQSYYAQSASLVSWYFKSPEEKSAGWTCGCGCVYGYWLAWTRGLGTVSLTACIMTPLYVAIAVLEYLDHKQKLVQQNAGAVGEVMRCVVKCAKCCLYCFEKLLRYINKTTITTSQIYNKGWWRSVQIVQKILFGDIILTAIVNGIIVFLMFLSKVIVAVLTAGAFMIFMAYRTDTEATGWLLSAAGVFVIAFAVSAVVLNIFENVMDIIFVAFQADGDISGTDPKYCDAEMGEAVHGMKDAAQNSGVQVGDEDAESAPPAGDQPKRAVPVQP